MAAIRPTVRTIVRWLLPAAWIVVAVTVGQAVAEALDGRSSAVRVVALGGIWLGWGIAAVACVVASTLSLTAVRVLVPSSIGVWLAALGGGASASASLISAAAAAVATALCCTPEVGIEMVQASAYGDEVRVPLRPPVGYVAVATAAWLIWLAAVITGPLLVAAGAYVPGVPLTVLAVAATVLLPRRWHQLSRRWLVFVPAGVVVHDPVVLAETLMVRRHDLRSISLALSGSGATDLTGPAAGHVLEIVTTEPVPVHLAPSTSRRESKDLTADRVLVAPSRPGLALTEATRRRFPVG
ncbi:MAG: hypothetical protein H0U01_01775 [Acidimicrobiia bacterium]|nr:hypothetical protein [Acidimicrobiia bacterium]